MRIPVRIQQDDFDVSIALAILRAEQPMVGAVVSFIGTARDMNEGPRVSAMELEHYPDMTETALEIIVSEAKTRWPIINALVVHRVGILKPLDQIVLVAVTACHRGGAFASCEFIMGYLKTEAPFWKKEQTPRGSRWVDARVSDEQALAKWKTASDRF